MILLENGVEHAKKILTSILAGGGGGVTSFTSLSNLVGRGKFWAARGVRGYDRPLPLCSPLPCNTMFPARVGLGRVSLAGRSRRFNWRFAPPPAARPPRRSGALHRRRTGFATLSRHRLTVSSLVPCARTAARLVCSAFSCSGGQQRVRARIERSPLTLMPIAEFVPADWRVATALLVPTADQQDQQTPDPSESRLQAGSSAPSASVPVRAPTLAAFPPTQVS